MTALTSPAGPRRTEATNSPTTYGTVERTLHWAVALLIATVFVLGVVAHGAPFGTDAELARKATLFSLHKTLGLALFALALVRIGWAVSQPRPAPLHPERRAETALAGVVHWLLYGALVLMPLSGWISHAAAQGFAPIWWPFGQSLPLVPKSPAVSEAFAAVHGLGRFVLLGAVALHVAGAVKHALIDRDATMGRMVRGSEPGALPPARGHLLPALAAAAVWVGTIGLGLASVAAPEVAAPARDPAPATASGWIVEDGTLAISVTQMGAAVEGAFADWTASIDFDEAPRADGTNGTARVEVATGSLTLGSVSGQATGDEFLAAGAFPVAVFDAVIRPEGDGYVAEGPLTIRDTSVDARLPFTLTLDGDLAQVQGTLTLDRREFGIGAAYPDEGNVGFAVPVTVSLTARRAP